MKSSQKPFISVCFNNP